MEEVISISDFLRHGINQLLKNLPFLFFSTLQGSTDGQNYYDA